MHNRTRAAVGTFLAMCLSAPGIALAWGPTGHRITAEIAERHLSTTAARQVRELTGGHSLAMLSTWADFIRSDSRWTCIETWHYVNVEDGQDLAQALARQAPVSAACRGYYDSGKLPTHVVAAIDFCAAVVRGDRAETRQFEKFVEQIAAPLYGGSIRLTALALLVHFVGDLHQPLHVGRSGDRGGNNITTNWFGETSKLHAVWDSGMIDAEGLSYTEFAAFLEAEFGSDPFEDKSNVLDWAGESFGYRGQVYEIWRRTSRDNYLPELGYDYAAAQIGLVKRRLYQGGRRLARLLDSVLP